VPNFSSAYQKLNTVIFNFVKFVATKKGMTTNFFHPSLLLLFLDPGSGIRDPGSGMGKNKDTGSGIGDKHPESATLHFTSSNFSWGLHGSVDMKFSGGLHVLVLH
jgi:hypothetical protein